MNRLSGSFALQPHHQAWFAGWAKGPTGFTLLEVLIALGITALIAFTVGSSLVLILRSEQTTRHLREAGLILQSVTTAELAGTSVTNGMDHVETDWLMVSDIREHEVDDPPVNVTWRVWTIARRERPSLRVEAAFRVRDED